MPEDAVTPVKRGPGRPRKAAVAPQVDAAPPPVDAWKTPEPAKFPPDEHIGQLADDPQCSWISFSEGDRQYRVEDGVIVERVR